MNIEQLQKAVHVISVAVSAVAPIDGVSIGDFNDRSTWRIDFADNASPAEKAAAADVLATLDPLGPTADDVRAEASRRMQVMFGARDANHLSQIIQNGQREAERLNNIRNGIPGVLMARSWTDEEVTRAAELWAADAAIETIRAASNTMEINPPSDYTDDSHWS